jgi:hypothetical protein
MKSFILLSLLIAVFSIFINAKIFEGGSKKNVKEKDCLLKNETNRCGRSESHTVKGRCFKNIPTGRCRKIQKETPPSKKEKQLNQQKNKKKQLNQQKNKKKLKKQTEKPTLVKLSAEFKDDRDELLEEISSSMNFNLESYKNLYKTYITRFKFNNEFLFIQLLETVFDVYVTEINEKNHKTEDYESLLKSILDNKDVDVNNSSSVRKQTEIELKQL